MMADNINTSEIKHFVREQLGCNCPDEVFSSVRVIDQPHAYKNLQVDCLIEIGGRLLLAICINNLHSLAARLELIMNTGRRYRDLHGFNRLRLVVATTHKETQDAVQSAYDLLTLNDKKLHLHFVDPAGIDLEFCRAIQLQTIADLK